MENTQAFRPGTRPLFIMGSTSSPLTGGQCSTVPSGDVTYLIANRGNNDAVIAYGATSGTANSRAIEGFITSGQGREGTTFVMARTQVSLTLTPNLFFFASTLSGNSPIVIEPGTGL